MSKYQPLADHLANLKADEWRPTFHELERILGFDLPKAAHKAGWWTNGGSGHSAVWGASGWEVDQERVSIDEQEVTFRRVVPVEETAHEPGEGPELPTPPAERLFEKVGEVSTVKKVAFGGVMAAALVGVFAGLAAMAARGVMRRR